MGLWTSNCAPGPVELSLKPPWSVDAVGVVLAFDAAGTVQAPTPQVVDHGPVVLAGEDAGEARLLLLEHRARRQALLTCGAAVESPWPPLPAPSRAWNLAFRAPLELEETTDPGPPLRFAQCAPPTACAQAPGVVSTLPLPGVSFTLGAPLPGGRWVLTGGTYLADVHPVVWLDSNGEVLQRADLPLVGLSSLCSDHRDGAYLVLADGELLRVSTSTTIERLPALPPGSRVADRGDGLIVVADPNGPTFALGALGSRTPLPDFPPRLLGLGLDTPERMALLSAEGIWVFDPQARVFRNEWRGDGFNSESRLVWLGDTLGVIGPAGALLRSPGGQWSRWQQPPAQVPVRWAVAVGEQAFVVGDFGSVQVWDGSSWCEYARLTDHVNWVGVAEGVVLAVTNATAFDRGPLLVRYGVPAR